MHIVARGDSEHAMKPGSRLDLILDGLERAIGTS